MMDFDRLCSILAFSSAEKEKAGKNRHLFSGNETLPEFLTLDFFNRCKKLIGLPPEQLQKAEKAVTQVCRTAENNPALRAYCNFLYDLTVNRDLSPATDIPEAVSLLQENAGVPAVLVALALYPEVRAAHEQLGIPERYSRGAIYSWVYGAADLYCRSKGFFGMFTRQLYWIRYSIDGKLFRIGRFEYQLHDRKLPELPLYRNHLGQLRLFAPPEWLISPEGERINTPEIDGVWQPVFQERDGKICGNVIDRKSARVEKNLTVLDAKEWKPAINDGDLVLDIHIPGGGGMTPEIINASLEEAVRFFDTYFHRQVKAFVCTSWIFNPDWQQELPDSNLAAFQKEVYLYCFDLNPQSGLFFVFGKFEGKKEDFPADNSIRKAFHRIWDAGRSLRTGGMVLMAEQLPIFRKKLQ